MYLPLGLVDRLKGAVAISRMPDTISDDEIAQNILPIFLQKKGRLPNDAPERFFQDDRRDLDPHEDVELYLHNGLRVPPSFSPRYLESIPDVVARAMWRLIRKAQTLRRQPPVTLMRELFVIARTIRYS